AKTSCPPLLQISKRLKVTPDTIVGGLPPIRGANSQGSLSAQPAYEETDPFQAVSAQMTRATKRRYLKQIKVAFNLALSNSSVFIHRLWQRSPVAPSP
ncbi:MAG: hypothetical protein M3329_07250, partial [Pseudomonadota bacterium]|nr:hypothetical protein [Pseudomonadota bacterium]